MGLLTQRRSRRAALLLCALAVAGTAAAVEPDPLFPEFGNPGYDVVSYDLDINAVNAPQIRAVATLSIKAQEALTSFSLDLHGFEVRNVAIDGVPTSYSRSGDKLVIALPSPIARGVRFTATIAYRGIPEALPDPTLENPERGHPLGWIRIPGGGSYVVSEPVGASSYFPCNDVPTDKATFTHRIKVPDGMTAVSNGNLERVRDSGPNQVFTWVMDQPMTTWNAIVDIDAFTLVEQFGSRVPIRHFITEQVDAAELSALKRTPKVIGWLSQMVGPYPFNAYGSVIIDDPRLGYALETGAMSTFPSTFIDVPVIAHEAAHQWFGNAVTVKQWKDLWLAEGFASYYEFLFPLRDDPAAFDETMRSIHADLVDNDVGPAVIDSPLDLFNYRRVYLRGAVVLYALELKVGTETFKEIVRAWYAKNRNKNASTRDFITNAEEVSGDPSVRAYLTDFIYKQALPALPAPPVAARMTAEASAERAAMGAALVRAFKARHRQTHATARASD